MQVTDLPALNAALNATAAVLLAFAFHAVRGGAIARHRALMLAATAVSALFLASYLYYHFHHGSTRLAGTGWSRPLYFGILISHTVLATALAPLLGFTLTRALRGRVDGHRRVARWTWPIWMYVSVTGVLIYFMLYRWFSA